MRKITLTVLLLSALSFFAQAQEKTFSITGDIELDKGNLLVLTQRPGKIDTLAKTAIANRQFSISGTTEEAVVAQLVIEGYAGGFVMILEPGAEYTDTLAKTAIANRQFSISGTTEEAVVAQLVIEGYAGGFVMILEPGAEYTANLTQNGNGDIRGGKLQTAYNEYQKIVVNANAESRALNKKASEAAAQKHFKTSKELQTKANKVQEAAFAKMNNIVRKNADNVLAAYLQTAGSERIMELEPLKQIYNLLSEKARETAPGKILANRIADLEKVSIAATAPDFTLTTPDGKQVSLYSVKGKLKIIDFWASWCGPCRMENPNMVKLYNDFKDKGLAIVSVSLDERKAPWVQAIKKDGMPWTHVSSLKGWKCDVVKQYNIDAVPSIIVLDENNRILAKNIRAEKLRAFVTEYLK